MYLHVSYLLDDSLKGKCSLGSRHHLRCEERFCPKGHRYAGGFLRGKPLRSLALVHQWRAVPVEQVCKHRFLSPVDRSGHEKLECLWIGDLDPDFLMKLTDRTLLRSLPCLAFTPSHFPLPLLLE